ncbi:MAG: 16S rRNA (adenine(1518)-N(6)/adenine(1519)-N(6))-dimethyltransferase RsmA [Acutalibacteraceae bacterium]|nr:16S rRNA (adenine(1518)-N(6)/adenine(1519)-N(6))-dimethyltransferase RsmA [Acutalibacteraceae bacterium]
MGNLSDIGVIKSVLQRHGFTFSKALGQNFIVNPSVCPRIAEEGGAREGVGVLEVGAGIGVLTAELAKRADKVVCVELDTRLLPVLDETLADYDNIKIINGDILKVDLHKILEEEFGDMPVIVCANLPYYITSPVIMRLLESRLNIESVTVMVQKEAAVRLCADVGSRDSGAVTVAVNFYSEAQKLFDVSRGSFMPAPNVDSAVIRLDIRKEVPVEVTDEKFFFSMVRSAFSQRRKTASNGISSGLGMPKQKVIEAIENAGLPSTVRAESLTMEELGVLCEELYKLR